MESKKINQLATNLAPVSTDLTVLGDPTTGELKKITLLQIASIFGVGIGSIGMVVPSGFSVSPATLTANGTFTITGAGTTAQYIRGDGSLATFPTFLSSDKLIQEVRNNSGATMLKGTIVYIDGAVGNKATIAKALATTDALSSQTYGVVQDDIPNNSNGYVVVVGEVTGLNTSALTDGQQLYLSGTVAGYYTTTKPYAPIHLVYVAIVLRSHPTLGVLGVKIQNGYEMDELHNVSAQSPANNDGLFYNSSTSLWSKNTIAGVLGYTPVTSARTISTTSPLSGGGDLSANRTLSIAQATTSVDGYLSATDWTTFNNKQNALTNPITGTGVSGQIAYWNGTNTQTGSNNLFWDAANSNLGIGTNSIVGYAASGRFINILSSNANSEIRLTNSVTGNTSTVGLLLAQYGVIAYLYNVSNAQLSLGTNNTERIRIYAGGNVGIGGTFTDGGQKLQVTGTTILTGALTVTGSTTAASLIARGAYYTPTLVAAANNDVLVGLDINPTFTNGAFTGVTNYAIRITGQTYISNILTVNNVGYFGSIAADRTKIDTGRIDTYYSGTLVGSFGSALYINGGGSQETSISCNGGGSSFSVYNGTGTTKKLQIFSTGNLLLQNGGTFTDAGYRLDVNGTARVTGTSYFSDNVGIGIVPDAYTNLLVNKNITGGTECFGIYSQGQIQSGVTATARYFATKSTTISSLSLNNLFHYSVSQGTFGAGTSVVIQVGFDVSNNMTGGVNNYGFRGEIASGTGRWNLYMSGSANNYLAGNLLIDSTSDTGQKLQVTGTTSFTGTTATDGGQLGSELTTTGSGTNWAGTGFATGYTHTTGSVVALTTSLAAGNGNFYKITYTITGRTAGSVVINYGGYISGGITSTGTISPRATATTSLSITPTTDFDGTLVLSILQITAGTASIVLKNSSGTTTNEIRSASLTNLFQGVDSGSYVTTGTNNTSYGYQALSFNTSGNNNTSYGNQALLNNTIGFQNTAIGDRALTANISGQSNVAVGKSSLTANTTGSDNVAVGIQSLLTNLTGGYNTSTGNLSLTANTNGSNNSATGSFALSSNTTGSSNNAFGYGALGSSISGNNNIGIGFRSGQYITGGVTINTILNNSIYIGHQTKALADNQTNQIVIGYSETGLGTNTTIIGNSSTITTAIRGRLLLGTTTDTGLYQLDVNGTARVSGALTVPGAATGFVTLNQANAGACVDISQGYNNNSLKILQSTNVTPISVVSTGYSSVFTVTQTTGSATFNNVNAGFNFTGTYQHNGAAGLGYGIYSIVTNNTGTSNILYSGYFIATANSSGATSVGMYISSSSTSGTAYGLLVNGGRSGFGTTTPVESAEVEILSTTRGFLPPRMTTTQKNAIATPAAGLVVYDTTLNKLCVYTTAWETITSL